MARCGGGSGCQCVTQGGQGITVTGNGSAAEPFRVRVRPSGDLGNCLRFGSDGGAYAPCSGDEGQDLCGVSVANLPEERLVFGRGGAGRLLAPDHTLKSFQRAVDLGVDGSHAHVRELGDGTPVCFPSGDMGNQTGIAGLTKDQLTAGGYANLPIRAGWNPDNASTNLGGRHGFFGFGERDTVGGVTLAQVLELVGRRAVLLLQMIGPYSEDFPQRVLDMIFRYCAHGSVIVAASSLDDLDLFTNAGVHACLFVGTPAEADENPPATVAARGVEWVATRLRTGPTNDQIIGYSAAGMSVVGYMANRHHDWELLDAIGARGVISDDALYMTMDPSRYRSKNMQESLTHSQVQPGMLGYWTDPRQELGSGPGQPGEVYWPHQGRGFYYPPDWPGIAQAFYMPGRMASSQPETSGVPYRTPSGVFDVNMGFMAPVPWPDNYVMECDISYRDTPASNRSTGFILGVPDDRAFDDRQAAGGGYWVVGLSWSGQVFAERWDNNVLVSENRTPGPALTEDTFYRCRVTVTPTSVTMAKLNASGAVQVQATVNDPILRGPYLFWYKKETTPANVWTPFAVAYRNLVIRQNT